MNNNILLIFGLTVITYTSRLFGVEFMKERELSPQVQRYFSYMPIAILVTLLVKQIMVFDGSGVSISPVTIISCGIAGIAIKITKSFLLSLILAIVGGVIVRIIFGI